MEEQKVPTIVANDVIVAMAYKLSVDGEEVDSADESNPLEFIQGCHNIITGLENQLYGMKIGEQKQVVVAPEDGYGEIDPEALVDIARSEFPQDIPLEVGVDLDIRDEDGDILTATIIEVGKTTVKLDFNHPLAGETLHFDIKVVGLRTPSEEELNHGHVHGSHSHEDEEFDEEFIEYFDDDESKEAK